MFSASDSAIVRGLGVLVALMVLGLWRLLA